MTFLYWKGKRKSFPWGIFPESIKICIWTSQGEEKAFQTLLFWWWNVYKDKTEYSYVCCFMPASFAAKGPHQTTETVKISRLWPCPLFGSCLSLLENSKREHKIAIATRDKQHTIERKKESNCKQSRDNLSSTIWEQNHWLYFTIILPDLITLTFFSPLLGILGAINCGNLKVNIEWWPWIWEVMEKQMLLLTKKITN